MIITLKLSYMIGGEGLALTVLLHVDLIYIRYHSCTLTPAIHIVIMNQQTSYY